MQNISNIINDFWQLSNKIVPTPTPSVRSLLLNGYGICSLLLFLANCSTANLNPEERRAEYKPISEEISSQQQQVLRIIDPTQSYQKGRTMNVTATDIWESTFIRWLTPLDENEQKFQAYLKLYHQGIEFTFLNGEQKGQIIGFDGRSYKHIETQKSYEDSSSISLYLESLQSYLEWSQTLLRNPSLEILGTKEIKNIQYRVFYVTEGSTEKLDKYDQYLIYINTKSGQIDYIEFTMRKLMKSYKGVIHYKDFKMIQGILMPFWIGIADNLLQPEFDHYIVVESITFSSSD